MTFFDSGVLTDGSEFLIRENLAVRDSARGKMSWLRRIYAKLFRVRVGECI